MNNGTYVFSQMMQLIHRQSFSRFVNKFKGNNRVGIVQLSVSGTIKGFGPGTILGPENEPEDWAWTETMQGSIFKVLSIGVSKFSDEFLLDS